MDIWHEWAMNMMRDHTQFESFWKFYNASKWYAVVDRLLMFCGRSQTLKTYEVMLKMQGKSQLPPNNQQVSMQCHYCYPHHACTRDLILLFNIVVPILVFVAKELSMCWLHLWQLCFRSGIARFVRRCLSLHITSWVYIDLLPTTRVDYVRPKHSWLWILQSVDV